MSLDQYFMTKKAPKNRHFRTLRPQKVPSQIARAKTIPVSDRARGAETNGNRTETL